MISIELNKLYRNRRGEIRRIVAPYYDGSQYIFIDHLNMTYTKHGVYDEHDFFLRDGDGDIYQLVEEVADYIPLADHCTKVGIHAQNLAIWVEAALNCNSWEWDAQQFDAALSVVNNYRDTMELPKFEPERI